MLLLYLSNLGCYTRYTANRRLTIYIYILYSIPSNCNNKLNIYIHPNDIRNI